MRCQGCDYRLWNLTSRQCPECGRPFSISQFEFKPNTVEFHCPHCDQVYFGTDNKGHLVPRIFDCVHCGQRVEMDEMILRPAEGIDEEETQIAIVPWLQRHKIGSFKAFFRTIGMALVKPGQLIQRLPAISRPGQAIWFGIVCQLAIALATTIPLLIFVGGAFFVAGGGPGGFELVFPAVAFCFFGLGTIILAAVWGLSIHAILAITGQRAGGLNYTFEALGYSAGANTPSVIPCFGPYVGWIWWLVSLIIMIQKRQKVQTWRAVTSCLAFPVLAIGTWAAFIAVMATTGSGPMRLTIPTPANTPGTINTSTSGQQTMTVLGALQDYHDDHDQWPDHGLDLFFGGYLDRSDLISSQTNTTLDDITVAGDSITVAGNSWAGENTGPGLTEKQLDEYLETWPDGVVAHRVGDYVFTYHKIDPISWNEDLWMVIFWPDPQADMPNPDPDRVTVGTFKPASHSRSTSTQSRQEFLDDLTRQNRLRAQYGLPPLLTPDKILHDQPQLEEAEHTPNDAPSTQ